MFRAVPVWLWPFVWLQLVVLFGWMNRQQREVLVRVDHVSGRIRVVFVEDAPASAAPWRAAVARVPLWQRDAVAEQALARRAAPVSGVSGLSGLYPCIIRGLSVHGQPVAAIDSS